MRNNSFCHFVKITIISENIADKWNLVNI